MYLLYSLLTFAVFVVVSPYFLYQAVRYRKYVGSLRQRLGYLPIGLNADDMADCILFALTRRPNVNIDEIVLMATGVLPFGNSERMLARLFNVALGDARFDPGEFRTLARAFGWDRPQLDSAVVSDVRERVFARLRHPVVGREIGKVRKAE